MEVLLLNTRLRKVPLVLNHTYLSSFSIKPHMTENFYVADMFIWVKYERAIWFVFLCYSSLPTSPLPIQFTDFPLLPFSHSTWNGIQNMPSLLQRLKPPLSLFFPTPFFIFRTLTAFCGPFFCSLTFNLTNS